MTLLETNLHEILRHLRQARRAMRRFMAVSSDWTAKLDVEEEFLGLRDAVNDFARHQFGISVRDLGKSCTSIER